MWKGLEAHPTPKDAFWLLLQLQTPHLKVGVLLRLNLHLGYPAERGITWKKCSTVLVNTVG